MPRDLAALVMFPPLLDGVSMMTLFCTSSADSRAIGRVQPVRLVLHEVRVGREAAGRGEEEPAVRRRHSQDALVSLQAEWDRLADQLWVVIGGINAGATGERISHEVHCRPR